MKDIVCACDGDMMRVVKEIDFNVSISQNAARVGPGLNIELSIGLS